jgi:asparagine synthase (glutamine-hydrolysing)
MDCRYVPVPRWCPVLQYGLWQVEPGTVVTVGANGIREQVYWSLRTREHTDDRADSVAHVCELLDDIVRRQLVADVPRCALLSGGLDSSAMFDPGHG